MSTTSPTTTTTTTTTRTTTTLAKTSRVLVLVEKAANFSFATNMAGVAKFSVYLLFTDSTTTSDKKSGKSVAHPPPPLLPLAPHTILMDIRVAQWQIINYLRVFTSLLFAVRTFASPVKPRKCFDI